ncbi:hypothetical protein CU097_015939 [Rhizopus azygosporus]|uniref:Uncharacterized protein n=1 Tax=Rhizopus azygosporus TaxID=86630 RepID=A0A367KH46_RHIAZ|nr:hypothetical protein CU097_015939 [Rhizopus azygosporus]CEG77508.1 hypothetical protein RMATCC62417_12247 [Rhizopus microsporus]
MSIPTRNAIYTSPNIPPMAATPYAATPYTTPFIPTQQAGYYPPMGSMHIGGPPPPMMIQQQQPIFLPRREPCDCCYNDCTGCCLGW